MVKHGLGERLSTGGGTQRGVEAKRLGNGEVRLHGVHRGTGTLLGRKDLSTTNVHDRVDTALSRVGARNLDQEHGLLETGRGEQLGGVTDTTRGGDDLTTTTVDRVGVQLLY